MVTDLLLISVGNTRTRVAHVRDVDQAKESLQPSRVASNWDVPSVVSAIQDLASHMPVESSRVVLASVNEPMVEKVQEILSGPRMPRLVRLTPTGTEPTALKIPVQHTLEGPITVGADRLLAALGAFSRSGEACVVIDAGTAVTVDYIDGFGVFQGGVIAPGLGMQLKALHEHTAALPKLEVPKNADEKLPEGPLGKSTREAMLIGCASTIRGLARVMIDRVAEVNLSYPRVIATGGDAPLLLQDDELIEHIVPDLVLIGMVAAWRSIHAVAGEE
jgi:type III pantothenate kinase